MLYHVSHNALTILIWSSAGICRAARPESAPTLQALGRLRGRHKSGRTAVAAEIGRGTTESGHAARAGDSRRTERLPPDPTAGKIVRYAENLIRKHDANGNGVLDEQEWRGVGGNPAGGRPQSRRHHHARRADPPDRRLRPAPLLAIGTSRRPRFRRIGRHATRITPQSQAPRLASRRTLPDCRAMANRWPELTSAWRAARPARMANAEKIREQVAPLPEILYPARTAAGRALPVGLSTATPTAMARSRCANSPPNGQPTWQPSSRHTIATEMV